MPAPPPLPRRSHLGLELSRGVRPPLPDQRLWVEGVDPGSPAERAGVQTGDALLAIGDSATNELNQVRQMVARLPVSQASRLLLQRGEQRLELWPCAEPLPVEALGVGEIVLGAVPWRSHRLRAVWSFPNSAGPVPAIWLLPGAAWLSEEHPIEPRSARLELVRGLTRAGFATLRVERSGLGDSEGPPCTELDLQAELEGWRAASRYFRAHPRVRADARFLYARSLGGMLAPLLSEPGDWSALAVWGTSAQPWPRCMLAAAGRQYRLAGRTGAALERTLQKLADLHELVYGAGLTPEQAFERRPDLRDADPVSFRGDYVYDRVAVFFQQLAAVDVASAWRALSCPVLALHGSSDWLSLADDSAEIARLAPRGVFQELAGIDHMMHERPSVEAAFAEPWGGTFTPVAVEALVGFYRRHYS
jgi:pimeloyl-ACP methyl ester carboxylesterase